MVATGAGGAELRGETFVAMRGCASRCAAGKLASKVQSRFQARFFDYKGLTSPDPPRPGSLPGAEGLGKHHHGLDMSDRSAITSCG